MNEEIKEILECMRQYGSTTELALLDYITNLRQEINKLTAESTEWESKCYDLQQELEEEKRIEEADLKTIQRLEEENERQSKAQVILDDMLVNYKQENETRQQDINNLTYQLAKMKEENERLNEWKKDLLNENIGLENARKEAIELLELKQLRYLNEDDYRICTLDLQEVKDILQNGSDS